MPHALIVDDNMLICSAVQSRLAELGFTSFAQSWTEDHAVESALRHHPDLVIGDTLSVGSPIEAARRISELVDTTILAVTADAKALVDRLPPSTEVNGPYALAEIESAVQAAKRGSVRPRTSGEERYRCTSAASGA